MVLHVSEPASCRASTRWACCCSGPPTASPRAADAPDWATHLADGSSRTREAAGNPPGERACGPGRRAARADEHAAKVADGVDKLGRWLADQVSTGLAGADRTGYAPFEAMAAAMVDAQAKGLARQLRHAATRPGSGEGWPGHLLEDYAAMWLLLRASTIGLGRWTRTTPLWPRPCVRGWAGIRRPRTSCDALPNKAPRYGTTGRCWGAGTATTTS
ncbi:hypothetical protein ACU686_17575 [Yinghuangia aomiensis]